MDLTRLSRWLPAAVVFTPLAIAGLVIALIDGDAGWWSWVVPTALIAVTADSMLVRDLTHRSRRTG